jgi:hypothetical protein
MAKVFLRLCLAYSQHFPHNLLPPHKAEKIAGKVSIQIRAEVRTLVRIAKKA